MILQKWTATLLIAFSFFLIQAQDNLSKVHWNEIDNSYLNEKSLKGTLLPSKFKTFKINSEAIKSHLRKAKEEFTSDRSPNLIVELPFPDGSFQKFEVYKTSLLPKSLNSRYPEIQTYGGRGIDDPLSHLKLDFGTNGMHAQILRGEGGSIYIDPIIQGEKNIIISYNKKDISNPLDFSCEVFENDKKESVQQDNSNRRAGDCQLRIYRLALACTFEYTQYHGGTKSSVMSAMVTSMMRVNGIFERDASIRMEFVPNNDDLIYLTTNDPYSNNNGGAMLGQNQTVCDDIIGSSNYDIGHVFSTGGGGVAYLNSPCSGSKAGGVTGLGNPIGDFFDVDYVAHEIGHQYGGRHTFNNRCGGNRSGIAAMEPGSASTIMGYAGICNPNVQSNSDDYFHSYTVQEMANFSNGSSCPQVIDLGNNAPIVSPIDNKVIPTSTSFELTAVAEDTDGDFLTYCWEQMDNEIATMPPVSTNTEGPAFRSFDPNASPSRYFPNLEAIIDNDNPQWEVLPSVDRGMNFRCTVRDNSSSNGCTGEEDVFIKVAGNAGPFLVVSPNNNLTWMVGDTEMIIWDVANTDNSPVNCSEVNILLSTDGGYTYPTVIASNVPNTGSYLADVPNIESNRCRVRIQGVDNVFFDISNTNFEIEIPPIPTFLIDVSPSKRTLCTSESTTSFTINLESLAGFNEEVALSIDGLPNGATAAFTPAFLVPNGETSLTIENLDLLTGGTYNLQITGTSVSLDISTSVDLELFDAAPESSELLLPLNQSTGNGAIVDLDWEEDLSANDYYVQVSTNPDFDPASIVQTATVDNSTFETEALESGTVYYWRVLNSNLCGPGEYSEHFSFQTAVNSCSTYENNNSVEISTNSGTINSVISVSSDQTITDVNVSMEVVHTFVGDLSCTFENPTGSEITLFDRPGSPASTFGCTRDNLLVSFDDEAELTKNDFEDECNSGDYAIVGNYKVNLGALSYFDNRTTQGDWTLYITDHEDEDAGALLNWSVELCVEASPDDIPSELSNNLLQVDFNSNEEVSTNNLNFESTGVAAEDIIYTLTSYPISGTLNMNATTLELGSNFTQANINNGDLSYTHNGDNAATDQFNFDVIDSKSGWKPGNIFNIEITQNPLILSTQVVNNICAGGADGQIIVNVNGGTPSYMYSIDGTNYQSENIFTDLSAGEYVVTAIDNDGFSVQSETINISQPSPISGTLAVDDNNITVNAFGGTGNLSYSINGSIFQVENIFTNLANGNYEITVIDENDCTILLNETISINNVAASAPLVNNITCNNYNDGIINITATGGTAPFMYSLNGEDFKNSNIFNNLSEGTYTVTIKDADDFTLEMEPIMITNPDPLSGSLNIVENNISCDANGGSGTLTYSIDGINYQLMNTFNDLPNANYVVFVKDENGCILELTTSILISTLSNANASQINAISCAGAGDASISVEVQGGTAPLSYSLDGVNYQNSNYFDNLMPGNYTAFVKDGDDFIIETEVISISEPQILDASLDVNLSNVTISATGGTGNISYSINGIDFQSQNIFTNLENGSYVVYVKDANGCQIEISTSILVNNLSANATLTQNITCNKFADGIITVNVGGGEEPYEYSLNDGPYQSSNVFENLEAGDYTFTVRDGFELIILTNTVSIQNPDPLEIISSDVSDNNVDISANGGTGILSYSLDGINYQSDNTFQGLANGIYTATIKDENNCSTSTTFEISFNSLVVTGTISKDLDCFDSMDGSITASVLSGGVEPYEYSIDEENFQASNSFENLGPGTYKITIRDGEGFLKTTNTITLIAPEVITVGLNSTNDEITVNAQGGTGELSYSLDNDTYQESNVFNNLEIGTYTVYVMDDNGCLVSREVVVSFNNLQATANVSQQISCFGEKNGIISASISGGTEPYSYSIDGETFQSEMTFENLEAGTYVIIIMDANGFTIDTEPQTIVEPSEIILDAIVTDDQIGLIASGGTGSLEYSIDNMNFQSSNIFEEVANGTYLVYARDENSCIVSIEIRVAYNTLAVDIELVTEILCFGELASISVLASGGAMPYQYSIDGGDYQDGNSFADLPAGTYDISVKDADDLIFQFNNYVITEPAELSLSVTTDGNNIMASVEGGAGAYEYSIDGINYGAGSIFENLTNGNYTIYVRDENGCIKSLEINLDAMQLIVLAAVNVQNIACNGNMNGSFTVEAAGGLAPYEYSIDGENFSETNVFENLSAGNYNVIARDQNGALSTLQIEITQPLPLTLTVEVITNSINIDASGGTGEYQYSIDGGLSFSDQSNYTELDLGTYTVGVMDENGCQSFIEVAVQTTSIDGLPSNWNIRIYPNPSSDFINLELEDIHKKDFVLNLYDLMGKKVISQSMDSQSTRLDLSNLESATYLLKINDGSDVGVVKIVVER